MVINKKYLINKFQINFPLPDNVIPICFTNKLPSEYKKTILEEEDWYHYFGELPYIKIYHYEFIYLEVNSLFTNDYLKELCRNIEAAMSKDPISLSARYLKERIKWERVGRPIRSKEKMAQIFDGKCSPCPHFNRLTLDEGDCNICGCGIKRENTKMNKLYWATTECPDKPPLWGPEPL